MALAKKKSDSVIPMRNVPRYLRYIFERTKDVPKLVKRCQEKFGRKTEQDCFAVVRSYGESTLTDSNGNEHLKFGSLYIHFERKYFEKFDGDVCYGPTLSFDFSRIKIDSKCKAQLTENEKQFLINLDVTF